MVVHACNNSRRTLRLELARLHKGDTKQNKKLKQRNKTQNKASKKKKLSKGEV
jgi:hypothetical protein